MVEIHETRDEINAQLDVTFLMKKIRSLEKVTGALME
jgi:hypothetical protein